MGKHWTIEVDSTPTGRGPKKPVLKSDIHDAFESIAASMQSWNDVLRQASERFNATRESFQKHIDFHKDICGKIKEISQFEKALHRIVGCTMPKIVYASGDIEGISDESFVEMISEAVQGKTFLERMARLVSVKEKLLTAIKSFRSKHEKMSKRRDGDGTGVEELKLIKKKLREIEESIQILEKRLELVLDRFLELRKALLENLVDAESKMCLGLQETAPSVVKALSHRHPVQRILEDLAEADENLTEGLK